MIRKGQVGDLTALQAGSRYDVAILGGGLAGLTLGIQLKQARPETSVLIAERRVGPAPEAAFKVGESTVEMSANYFAEVVGMKDHLDANELPKAGLRFFFPAGDNSDITQRVEWGATDLPVVPAYQVDRGRFENALTERNVELGNEVVDGAKAGEVEFGAEDQDHTITIARDGASHTVQARWVVDATGPHGLLKKKLGLAKSVEHKINSVWFRLGGGIDIDAWSDDEAWLARMNRPGIRRLSTNHLMGEGYWCWLIPLASGPISVGIVFDPRFHDYEPVHSIDGMIEWLQRHEPQLAAEVAGRREQIEDFHGIQDFAYSCERVFSPDRWCLVGVSGCFADPFYSPGSDFIAQGNTFTTDIIVRDLGGEDARTLRRRILQLNAQYLGTFETAVRGTYTNHYQLFGNAEVMSAKLMWEFASYWAIAALPFIKGRLDDSEFADATKGDVRRIISAGARLEQMFRDWHALGQLEWRGAFVSHRSCPAFWQFHLDLHEDFDDQSLKARYTHNADVLEAMAVVLFHTALQRLDPEHAIDPDTKVNPAAISLFPERWESDKLLGGKGLSLNEARERLPGIDEMLISRVVEPV
jgi:flavin-dependent dehydrogenase